MVDKFIMMDLSDERSKDLADVLGNKTCKKIIDYLSDIKEASEKDIADKLSVPINTIEYNLNKLIKAELVEKTKNFFWSVKGRKIDMYRLSNKKIIISPKSSFKGILPAFIAILAGSFGIKILTDRINYNQINSALDSSTNARVVTVPLEKAGAAVGNVQTSPSEFIQPIYSNLPINNGNAWAWFLLGGLVAILIFLLWIQFKNISERRL